MTASFFHDVSYMEVDGSFAYMEDNGGFIRGFSFFDPFEDFKLSI